MKLYETNLYLRDLSPEIRLKFEKDIRAKGKLALKEALADSEDIIVGKLVTTVDDFQVA